MAPPELAKPKKSAASAPRAKASSKKSAAKKTTKTTKKIQTAEPSSTPKKLIDTLHPETTTTTPTTLPEVPEPEQMIPSEMGSALQRSTTAKRMTNRQKCLVLGGRNMSSKARHLLLDLRGLMPHSKEHSKLGGAAQHHQLGDDITELCALHQCNAFLYMDPHRSDVSYIWLGQTPDGPSVKLQVTNIHTADEIRMAGNCLKYSRPLLHFDRSFETLPHLRVVKSLLHMSFNTPRYHPKSKPFIDRIMSFFWLDDHIWVRNYQIVYPSTTNLHLKTTSARAKSASTSSSNDGGVGLSAETLPALGFTGEKGAPSLLEIGPRFTLEPVMILNGVCKGNVLWKSQVARAPTEQRRDRKRRRVDKLEANERITARSETHRALHPAPQADPLDMVFQ